MKHRLNLCALALASIWMPCERLLADNAAWPEFRGPGGQGNAGESAPLEWSEQLGVRWRTDVPGRGWSSPVVEGDDIWITTAIEQQGDTSKLEGRGGLPASAMNVASELSLRAVCVDRGTGEVKKNIELFRVENPQSIHSLNSYASPTPVIQDGRLYGHFGRYGTKCIDTKSGEEVWQREFQIEHYVGPGSSPVLCDDVLVLTCDGADQQFIVAIDKATGETVWRTPRPPIRSTNPDMQKSYCTPLVVEEHGGKQIVIPGAQWIVAYAPEDGRELWRIDHGSGFSLVPRPVADDARIYCCTGFSGAGLLAIRRGGQGDIGDTHIEWEHNKQAPTQPSPVLRDGKLYMVSDNGIGQCLNAATGEVLWKKRFPGNYSASPLSVGDRIYFFSREGEATVVDALSDDGQVMAKNSLDGQHMATPAVVQGELIVRTEKSLYAIGDYRGVDDPPHTELNR